MTEFEINWVDQNSIDTTASFECKCGREGQISVSDEDYQCLGCGRKLRLVSKIFIEEK